MVRAYDTKRKSAITFACLTSTLHFYRTWLNMSIKLALLFRLEKAYCTTVVAIP